MEELRKPFIQYVPLITQRTQPYHWVCVFLCRDMERKLYEVQRKLNHDEFIYSVNPREVGRKFNLSSITVSRVLRTFLYKSKLKENDDWYTTTSSGGVRNFKIRVTPSTIYSMKSFLGV